MAVFEYTLKPECAECEQHLALQQESPETYASPTRTIPSVPPLRLGAVIRMSWRRERRVAEGHTRGRAHAGIAMIPGVDITVLRAGG